MLDPPASHIHTNTSLPGPNITREASRLLRADKEVPGTGRPMWVSDPLNTVEERAEPDEAKQEPAMKSAQN